MTILLHSVHLPWVLVKRQWLWGYFAVARGEHTVAIGNQVEGGAKKSVAIGTETVANNERSISIGSNARSLLRNL